jgi:hypothetical protein
MRIGTVVDYSDMNSGRGFAYNMLRGGRGTCNPAQELRDVQDPSSRNQVLPAAGGWKALSSYSSPCQLLEGFNNNDTGLLSRGAAGCKIMDTFVAHIGLDFVQTAY